MKIEEEIEHRILKRFNSLNSKKYWNTDYEDGEEFNLVDFLVKNCFLAGGSIRDLYRDDRPLDYDIYFKSESAVKKFKNFYDKIDNKIKKLYFTESHDVINYGSLQFILFTPTSPRETIESFDFTINQNFYDFDTKELYIESISSIINKRLILNDKVKNIDSLLSRLLYFVRKGYTIDPTTLGVIVLINQSDLIKKHNLDRSELSQGVDLSYHGRHINYPIIAKTKKILHKQIKNTKIGTLL